MSKTLMAVVLVGAVLVGGYFIMNSQKNEKAEMPNNEIGKVEETESNTEQPAGKKMAFSQFLKQDKGAYQCDVKQAVSDIESTGTVYMNAGNIRGDFKTIAEGRKMNSYFIMKDGYTYNWSDLAPMGVKVKVQTTDTPSSAAMQATYSWNAEQIGEYNCTDWAVDESKFTIPTSVTFTEIR